MHPGRGGEVPSLPPATSDTLARLTSGRLLARNGIINTVGQLAPVLVALAAVPMLVHGLGTDRFGTLTLVWMVIGYLSILDLGLGWALTQVVAERLGADRESDVPEIAWTVLGAIFLLGLGGAALAILLAPWIVHDVLNLEPGLAGEAVPAVYVLAVSLPFVATTASMRGLLEARQRFGVVNALRVPLAVFTYAGPLLVFPFSRSLVAVVAVLAAGRIVAWPIHLFCVLRAFPAMWREIAFRPRVLAPLLRFGGWSTVSNVISAVMSHIDRFLIGALISVTAVAFYVASYDVVTKMLLLPIAVGGVAFPAFAASYERDPSRTGEVFGRAVRIVYMSLFPATLVIVTFAYEGLHLWLGREFAVNGTRVAQILAVGMFINGLAQMPFAVLQGMRRPDLAARVHLCELPLYLVVLYWLASSYGIIGVAAAWTLRVTADAAILFVLVDRMLPRETSILKRLTGMLAGMLLVVWIAAGLEGLPIKLGFVALVLPGYCVLGWRGLLRAEERAWMRTLLARGRRAATPV